MPKTAYKGLILGGISMKLKRFGSNVNFMSFFVLALAMAFVVVFFNLREVYAKDYYIDVELGKVYSLDIWGTPQEEEPWDTGKYFFSYTPAKDGCLIVDASGNDEIEIVVKDKDNKKIATNIDEYGYYNEQCVAALTGGEKYTIEVDGYVLRAIYNNSKVVFNYNVSTTQGIKIDADHFPDEQFRQYVMDNFDYSKDGYLSDYEIKDVDRIDIYMLDDVTSMKGVEIFTELTYLSCDNQALETLDVRNLTKLKTLDCGNNDNLKALDVSTLKDLERLECASDDIKELDLHNCKKLKVLRAFSNDLSSIDLSFLPMLEEVHLSSNPHLSTVDLSHNTRLKKISIGSLGTSIDLSIFPDLEDFSARYSKLESLDLSKNHKLTHLDFTGCKSCESVNIKGCHDLRILYGTSSKISSLDISDCPLLVTAYKNTAETTSTDKYIHYEYSPVTYRLYLDLGVDVIAGDYDPSEDLKDLVEINEENFPDEAFRTSLSSWSYDRDENGWFSKEELKKIKSLYLSRKYGGKRIQSLKGIEYFTEITSLNCSYNNLTELDVSKNTKLEIIDCRLCYLEKITLFNPNLTELYCSNNYLTGLDLSGSPKLKVLECQKNVSIKDLNITGCNDIEYLSCFRNNIDSIDIKNNMNLSKAYNQGDQGGVGLVLEDGNSYSGTGYVLKTGSKTYALYVDNKTKITAFIPTPTPTASPIPTATPTAKPSGKPTSKPTGSPAEPTKAASVSLTLNKKTVNIVCGKTDTLKATLKGSNTKVAWKSSDTKVATVDSNGKITAKMAGEVTITATAAGKTAKCVVTVLYKDVTNTKDFWYAPTNYLTAKGVVKGYDNQTKFKPANKCTRAQMVTFIWRLMGEPAPKTKTCKFSDVKKTDYFYKACIWGNENHIVEGYKDGTFGPQIVCARRHAVTFLWRLAKKPKPTSTKNKFKDVKKSDYFYTATLWASEKKILAGYSDGTFRPNGDCLRRQMVTFLYKYDKFINGKG